VHLHGRRPERDVVTHALSVEARADEQEEPGEADGGKSQQSVPVEGGSEW